jgi:hypothetical protein
MKVGLLFVLRANAQAAHHAPRAKTSKFGGIISDQAAYPYSPLTNLAADFVNFVCYWEAVAVQSTLEE